MVPRARRSRNLCHRFRWQAGGIGIAIAWGGSMHTQSGPIQLFDLLYGPPHSREPFVSPPDTDHRDRICQNENFLLHGIISSPTTSPATQQAYHYCAGGWGVYSCSVSWRAGTTCWTSSAGRRQGGDDQNSFAGKWADYRSQLHHLGVAIAGLQETRLQDSRIWIADGFCFISAASGGVALVVNTTIPIGFVGARPVYIDTGAITVLVSTSRLLVARVPVPEAASLFIIVGHAPHQGRSDFDKTEWLHRAIDNTMTFLGGSLCLGFFDANADVGQPPRPDHSGPFDASSEDTNGRHLARFLAVADCWLPSTYEGCHSGSSTTWFSNASLSGWGKRLDYFAIRCAWKHLVLQSFNSADLDN